MNGKKDINNIHQASDFKAWNHTDMAGAFWVCLGRYIKNPNEHDLTVINAAYLWAVHDNHALANSFSHALKWAGIDLYTEMKKWRGKGV